jgi:hypothetical protein
LCFVRPTVTKLSIVFVRFSCHFATVLRSFRGLFITKAPASYKGISWESAAKVYNAAAKMESDYR